MNESSSCDCLVGLRASAGCMMLHLIESPAAPGDAASHPVFHESRWKVAATPGLKGVAERIRVSRFLATLIALQI